MIYVNFPYLIIMVLSGGGTTARLCLIIRYSGILNKRLGNSQVSDRIVTLKLNESRIEHKSLKHEKMMCTFLCNYITSLGRFI